MTTVLVYGTADSRSYISSGDAAYATAQSGPADTVTAGAYRFGQASGYTLYQSFLAFSYPAVAASDIVSSAVVRLSQKTHGAGRTTRSLEIRQYGWQSGGLVVGDWRTPTQLSALTQYGIVGDVQLSAGKTTYAGSEELRSAVAAGTLLEMVLISNRQRIGLPPTDDESSEVWTVDASGTSLDPCLIYTTYPKNVLAPILGAAAQLSDGTSVYLAANVTDPPTINLRHVTAAGAHATAMTLPVGSGSSDYANVKGAQGFSLAVDSADNVYVVSRAGNAENSLRLRGFTKGSGYVWTSGPVVTVPLPSYDEPINNVAIAWHDVAGGTLVVLAGHTAGAGINGGTANDVSYAVLDAGAVRTGSGTVTRASGSGVTLGVIPATSPSAFNAYANETGNGLDVIADHYEPTFGYVASFHRGQVMGDTASVALGRYVLNATGAGFTHASYQDGYNLARKDGSARVRIVSIGSGLVAVVAANPGIGTSLTATVFQVTGTSSGAVVLGEVVLGEESLSVPDGPTMAVSSAWDAVYCAADNSLWIYYRGTTNGKIYRTSIDLNTYHATRVELLPFDYGASNVIQAIRVPRNAWVTDKILFSVAYSDGVTITGANVLDTFNIAPLAPTLATRANYDASLAADFTWTFNDPNSGDTQSAYELQVEDVADGSVDVSTGKVVSAVASRTIAGGTLVNGKSYRWRVRTWDASDVVGPWSGYGAFTTSASGSVTITSPAVDNPSGLATDDLLVIWSVTGTVQAWFRVWAVRNDTGVNVFDSFKTPGTDTFRTVVNLASDVEHTISVQVWNSSDVASGIGTRLVTPSYSTPDAPEISLTAMGESGYVLVSVTNPVPTGDRPAVVSNQILRRKAGSGDPWEILGTCDPDGSFQDYTAPSRIAMEYKVRGYTA